MKKKYFNIIVIIIIAVFLGVLAKFGLLEKSAKFMLIPILSFYFIGQYSERKFKNWK
jgi:ABC-type multidrug transport system permease subunit